MKKQYYNTPAYFINGQHRITITLIGVGGTGSLILPRLARLHHALNQLEHPGLFVIAYDDDTVEPFNVGRQLFLPGEENVNKAISQITKINHCFGLDWKAKAAKFPTSEEILKARHNSSREVGLSNIFITAVDNVKTRADLKNTCDRLKSEHPNHFDDYNRPYLWLDCGNTRDRGQTVLSTIVTEPNQIVLKDVFELYGDLSQYDTEELQGPSCSYAESLREQDLFVNDSIALSAVNLLWKLFKDKRISVQGSFNHLDNFKSNPIPIAS